MWTYRQVQTFLAEATGHQLYPLFLVIIVLALAPEEALGLYWTDVDFKKRTLQVSRTLCTDPKGKQYIKTPRDPSKHRTLQLPLGLGDRLLDHFHTQKVQREISKNSGKPSFVFTTQFGAPIRAATAEKVLHALCKRAGLKPVPLSELRIAHFALLDQ